MPNEQEDFNQWKMPISNEPTQTLHLQGLPEGQLATFFGRLDQDASSGWNSLTISGLPTGTRVISVWMTEWKNNNTPHAAGAFYNTVSVQLYSDGRACRVRYHMGGWPDNLPTGAQIIYGP